jgi:hypothetical protein
MRYRSFDSLLHVSGRFGRQPPDLARYGRAMQFREKMTPP